MAYGAPIGLLLALTYSEPVVAPPGDAGAIGTPIGMLLSLTYSEGGASRDETPTGGHWHPDDIKRFQNRQEAISKREADRKQALRDKSDALEATLLETYERLEGKTTKPAIAVRKAGIAEDIPIEQKARKVAAAIDEVIGGKNRYRKDRLVAEKLNRILDDIETLAKLELIWRDEEEAIMALLMVI